MKRIIALLCALLLLFTCAFADETASFTFRSGIRWGMTDEEVQAIEGPGFCYSQTFHGIPLAFTGYQDIDFSVYTGGLLAYTYIENDLCGAVYLTYSASPDDELYLRTALTCLYGESEPYEGTCPIVEYMLEPVVGSDTNGHFEYLWTMADGTTVLLYFEPNAVIGVFYLSPETNALLSKYIAAEGL